MSAANNKYLVKHPQQDKLNNTNSNCKISMK